MAREWELMDGQRIAIWQRPIFQSDNWERVDRFGKDCAHAAQANLVRWLLMHSAVEELPLRDGGLQLRTIPESVIHKICQELGIDNH